MTANSALQHRLLVNALYRAARASHPVGGVKRTETYLSTLLLVGDFAYKIKKPVRLDFVDYSSLERRHFFCREEVRLNRRYAPGIYLDCISINGRVENPVFGGAGPVIEYAVKMRRFENRCQGDALARRKALNFYMIDALASTIAGYHASASGQSETHNSGSYASISSAVLDNVEELRGSVLGASAVRTCTDLAVWSRGQLECLRQKFSERIAGDHIRECHGDLHLGNLILYQGVWIAFDCIEFDKHFRCIDVISDLAFTLMDLCAHHASSLANRLLNRYLEITGDYAGLTVLRLYMVHRALIRSKVMCLSAQRIHTSSAQKRLGAKSRVYLRTASKLSRQSVPRLVITHGLSGSGKSYAARWASDHFGYVQIRSDVERRRLNGHTTATGEFVGGANYTYSKVNTRDTYHRLFTLAEVALASGWRVILDATFLEREYRDEAHLLARHMRCPFSILVLVAPIAVMRERLRARGTSDASEATDDVLAGQLSTYRPLDADETPLANETSSDPEDVNLVFARMDRD